MNFWSFYVGFIWVSCFSWNNQDGRRSFRRARGVLGTGVGVEQGNRARKASGSRRPEYQIWTVWNSLEETTLSSELVTQTVPACNVCPIVGWGKILLWSAWQQIILKKKGGVIKASLFLPTSSQTLRTTPPLRQSHARNKEYEPTIIHCMLTTRSHTHLSLKGHRRDKRSSQPHSNPRVNIRVKICMYELATTVSSTTAKAGMSQRWMHTPAYGRHPS